MSDQRAGGIAWCYRCKAQHPRESFGVDRTRGDGRARSCLASRRVKTPKTRTSFKRHGWLAPARDGDKLQARRRVNYLVEKGRIPKPGELACLDCGHKGRGRRHEYDHARGYDAKHQLDVEAVCSKCHHDRERRRSHG